MIGQLLIVLALAVAPVVATASLRVGVAPFEVTAEDGDAPSTVASRLAARIAEYPIERVVPPSELGAEATADPRGRDVRTWAARAGVDAVVVGSVRSTSDPDGRFDVAVEVRSGNSGGSLSAFQIGWVPGAAGDAALDSLASSVLASLGFEASALPEVGAASSVADSESNSGLRLPGFNSDEPISIKSEELEVITREGSRTVIFDRDVQVVQGDVQLWADHLEAVYPKGASRPDRLEAKGQVRVQLDDKRAWCNSAVYLRADKTVTCFGEARLMQGCDVVRGEQIRFDLDREAVRVEGAASVELIPDCEGVPE